MWIGNNLMHLLRFGVILHEIMNNITLGAALELFIFSLARVLSVTRFKMQFIL